MVVPCCEGTVTFAIGCKVAEVSKRRSSSTSMRGCRLVRYAGLEFNPPVFRSTWERPPRIRSHMPCLLRLDPHGSPPKVTKRSPGAEPPNVTPSVSVVTFESLDAR